MGVTVYSTVRHIGPGQVYLAKKPDGVKLNEWDGDGDWFKIDYSGPVTDESWKLLGANQYDCMYGTSRNRTIAHRRKPGFLETTLMATIQS